MAGDLKSLNNYVVKLRNLCPTCYDRVDVIHCGHVSWNNLLFRHCIFSVQAEETVFLDRLSFNRLTEIWLSSLFRDKVSHFLSKSSCCQNLINGLDLLFYSALLSTSRILRHATWGFEPETSRLLDNLLYLLSYTVLCFYFLTSDYESLWGTLLWLGSSIAPPMFHFK